MSSASGPADPGLQAQRTSLAWTRTGTSLLAVVVLLARSGIVHHQPVILAGAVLLFIGCLMMWRTGSQRAQDGTNPRPALGRGAIARATVITTGAGVMAVLCAVLGR